MGATRGWLWVLVVLGLLSPALAQTGSAPRCKVCGQPVTSGYRLRDGSAVCKEHLDQALPHCFACHKPIPGDYRVVGPNEVPVCDSCYALYPHCDVCGLPVDRNGRSLPDGRYFCREHRDGIYDQAQAGRLFLQASDEVLDTFGQRLDVKLPPAEVRLVDGREMIKLADGPTRDGRAPLGLTKIPRSIHHDGRATVEAATVYLISGLPRQRLLTVAAHEYAHMWHSQNHPDYNQVSRRMQEGFAEWVAYHVAQSQDRPIEVKAMLTKKDSDYVDGLHRFLELEREVGSDGVFEYALTHSDI
ncbi:MAG: hypothetical protein KC910_22020 [Candidatus Eremiobacteraeota bacterium]|nr:hypothetical protein [Candidatus Eremiobacteraeota bacterium]